MAQGNVHSTAADGDAITVTVELSPSQVETIRAVQQRLGAPTEGDAVCYVVEQFREMTNEVKSGTPSNTRLRRLAQQYPPPPEWFAEDEEKPF